MIVPNIGTSIACARLHFHVSGAKRPLPASFFFPPVWPIRTRHDPYNSVSGEKHLEETSAIQQLK